MKSPNKQEVLGDFYRKDVDIKDFSSAGVIKRVDTMGEETRKDFLLALNSVGIDEEVFKNSIIATEDEENRKKIASLIADFRMVTDKDARKAVIKELATML